MSTAKKIQIRGVCQCCGNWQAVLGKGTMSKHGYTVEGGWFSGVCSGEYYAPLQKERARLDEIVEQIKEQIVDLNETVSKLKSGKTHPATVTIRGRSFHDKDVQISWEQADKSQRETAVARMVWDLERRIKSGNEMVEYLPKRATEIHGTDLLEVDLDAEKPEPIRIGDKRKNSKGTEMVVHRLERARVYYREASDTSPKPRTWWVGTSLWRRMEKV